ncbi:LuxR C-terminal-related transcriptional regulator [Arthrobacter sp. BE255]|uniref:ATP-binding protein n=1 Tax=Arthrobacter sp. BE255 TaxID=2817721 RepID=UPI0028554F85|nr:LuxR C-terminal-related transcriptional regulator [Arthrobacter sp. BE255]MDR7159809.1 putative ATPase/DNA-binding CsgD family transcriptional regulator [Arthrobacter sp. BE255]
MSTEAAVVRPTGGHNLTSFIGRRRELAEARELMSRSRLLTLAGPGGVGKTRLAAELSSRTRKAFRDGVWTVELAALDDNALVGSQIAAALRLPDQSNRSPIERISDYVEERQLLLVLDNCEHLLDAVSALAATLLDFAPELRVIATSREPLGILGEQVYQVPPLSAPAVLDGHAGAIEAFESVRLLVDRAKSVDARFEITDGNRLAVAQLCQMLDGIPLAIELAAARLRSVSVVQLVERLDRRFDILTGGNRAAIPRQKTLRALIDWSYELCTQDEQLLWARLAVFPAGFDVKAVEEVCGFGQINKRDILDLLDHLVAKSLVVAENDIDGPISGDQGRRYRQLMTFREYGAELLESIGESPELRRRQRDHYLGEASQTVALWCGPEQANRLAAARRDHTNILSALEWSATTPGEELAGMNLAALLRYHWIAGGNLSDGRRWLDRMLGLDMHRTPERGTALWVAAWVSLLQGDREPAQQYLTECRSIADDLDDQVLAGHVDHWEALSEVFKGRLEHAIELFGRAAAVHRRDENLASELTALFLLAWTQMYAGQMEEALATCRQVLAESGKQGERWSQAYGHAVMGLCQWHLGQLDEARQSQIAALEIQRDFHDGLCVALTIEQMSWTAASNGRYESAAILFQAAQSVWKGIGTTISAFGPLETDFEQTAAQLRNELGDARYLSIIDGRPALSIDQAVELALKSAHAAYVSPRTATPAGHKNSAAHRTAKSVLVDPYTQYGGPRLTEREAQVAALVAQGRSNKEIAAELVLSHRTIGRHIERILAKLGFTSRTQIASWVASRTKAG